MLRSVGFSRDGFSRETITSISPDPSGFTIRAISGLDAGKSNVHISEMALIDGGVFNSARISSRNIVFELGYGEELDPEEGRHRSYKSFPLKKEIDMVFVTDTVSVTIRGIVESNEANIFTEEPFFQISVLCPDPYFRTLPENRKEVTYFALTREFEFPFSNESLDSKLLSFGEYKLQTENVIFYEGSVDTGFTVSMSFSGPVENPAIYHEGDNGVFRLDSSIVSLMTGGNFNLGDRLDISTIKGSKRIVLTRNSKKINILNALTPDSSWLMLHPGSNTISVIADSGIENVQTVINFDVLYEGI